MTGDAFMDRSEMTGYSRRGLLGAMGAAGAAVALLPGVSVARTAKAGWMPGLQLYTLGDAPAKDLDGTLRAVARIGYRAVELPGDYGKSPADLRRAITAAGLVCPAIHVVPQPMPGAWDLDGDLAALADRVRELGARRAVVSIAPLPENVRQALFHPPAGGLDQTTLRGLLGGLGADHWKWAADLLNKRAAGLARSGVKLAYHNHGFEFLPLVGGGTGYDLLLAHTDPALVSFEMDVGWVVSAGQDVVALLERAGPRVTMMHLKDAARISTEVMEMAPANVGTGIVPWAKLAVLIRRFAIRDLFVEQEPPFPGERIDSARIAYDYLSPLFATAKEGAR